MPATFNDLIDLMDRLRAPNGCPWDREQTYSTLAPMLLEEAYEAFEAVEDAREGRPAELCDELGDLLFQIVFYAQVAKERGEFTMDDVTTAIHDKMVRRHPHVFGDVTADDAATVLLNWKTVDDIFDKLHEEIEELRSAINDHSALKDEANHARVREELGDLLFAATNIARHMQVEPEAALKLTNRKFRRRFEYIENALHERGQAFDETSIDELEALWQEAKQK